MSAFVDLHTHSTASDGTDTPATLVRVAHGHGLAGIALTDHDTIAGCAEAADEARRVGIRFLCGIEISCEFPRPGTMHLLGYGVDPASAELRDLTTRLLEGRRRRNTAMVAALAQRGIPITLADVEAQAAGGVVGRPHFAAVLVARGYAASVKDAFDSYLGQGGRVYLDKETVSPARAIALIRAAGGMPTLAHPVQLKRDNDAQLVQVIKDLRDMGLEGLEVLHSDHRASYIDQLSDLADRLDLVKTGGSDFHGGRKPHITLGKAGDRRIPIELMDAVERRAERVRTSK